MNFKATTKLRGDETRGYDVTDYKATTVGEFVGEVLSGNGKKEWGDFRISKENGDWTDYHKYEYKRGELLETIPYDVFKCRIKNVTGDGGWSRMDYFITVAEENETENDVRIGDRVFMDGTEVFKNIKGITYDTSGVSINKDAETPIEKSNEKQIMNFHEMIEETFPLYEDMNDTEIAQTIWRRRGAEIISERIKEQFIEWAVDWLNENQKGFIMTDLDIEHFKKYAEEQL